MLPIETTPHQSEHVCTSSHIYYVGWLMYIYISILKCHNYDFNLTHTEQLLFAAGKMLVALYCVHFFDTVIFCMHIET